MVLFCLPPNQPQTKTRQNTMSLARDLLFIDRVLGFLRMGLAAICELDLDMDPMPSPFTRIAMRVDEFPETFMLLSMWSSIEQHQLSHIMLVYISDNLRP